MVHGVLFIMQFNTAIAIGIHIPMDISIVLCFISYEETDMWSQCC